MADNTLAAVISEASREPAELPRLTAAQVFIHYGRMGTQLEQIVAAYKEIPADTPQGYNEHLKAIIKGCDYIIKTADRLLESNR